MTKFSWKKINDIFGWNAFSVLEYFFLKQGIPVPPYLNRKIPKIVKGAADCPYIIGSCFLINLDDVLRAAEAPNELYMYIELASKRNVFDYHVRGMRHLPLALVEEYQIEWIEINPLMKIENNNIYFLYEQEKQ
jgi:hypothetical protein